MTTGPERVRTVDYHVGGQPLRIVLEGGPSLVGASAAERRVGAIEHPELDAFRTFLCWEPRGHADMYAAYLFDSADPDCDFGAVFCHNSGYPTSCGHGALALAVFAVESGLVNSDRDGETVVTIEVPAGHAVVRVGQREGVVHGVRVHRGPSHPLLLDQRAKTSYGPICYDLAFSGATFAVVDARSIGLTVDAAQSDRLVAFARELSHILNATTTRDAEDHAVDERLSGVFGIILFEGLESHDGVLRQRAVNIFNHGWIERSPGGAMTGARLVLLRERGEIVVGQHVIQESISGASVLTWIDRVDTTGQHPQVFTALEGTAHRTGEHVFAADPRGAVAFSLR